MSLFRSTLSIGRTFVYCWLASLLLGCSLPHPFTNHTVEHSRPHEHSFTTVDIPAIVSETPSLPQAEPKAGQELHHDGGSFSAGLPEETIEKKTIQKNDDTVSKETDTTWEKRFTTADDDLIDLWRNNMDEAMKQPTGQRILRISSAVETHHRVRHYIDGFCGRQRDFFEGALARSGKYRAMMTDILRKEGLPEKLVYLALIESGFSPHAYSRAHAMGPWQFIRSTALHYGLTINSWIDERRDPVLSTHAAAAYLKDLHRKFGEWFLAAAAYNAGEGRVGTALQRSKTNDFWLLRQNRRHLKLETRDYVPKFVAAVLIAGEPEKYGFEQISYEEPLEHDEVTIHRPLRLQTVAKLADTNLHVIKELNPALLRNFTPPNDDGFTLRLPVGSGENFLTAYKQLPASRKIKLTLHRVKKGEVLSRIAKRHGVTISQLMKENGLKSGRLRLGQELVIVRSETTEKKIAARLSQ